MKSGNLNLLEPSGPIQACNGTALPFFIDQIVRNHNPEEYNTNCYNGQDNSKSQPSTYSESNLWTDKAVAWTVLEMWDDWTMQVSGEAGRTVGGGIGSSGGEFF